MREGGRLKKRKRDREREIEREGGLKQMCQNCLPAMNVNTLCITNVANFSFSLFFGLEYYKKNVMEEKIQIK